jgi:3-hydroxybutyryl-CoA dehydratase
MSAARRTIASVNEYFDEFQVGDRFVSKRGRTVTEADLVAYAGLSGDYSSLHTDAEWAKAGPFGARIAHGCLTLSLATGLEFALMGDDQDKVLGFYGMDRVRFVKPVFIGDTIQLEGEVIGLEDKDDKRGVLTVQQVVKNQHGETCVALQKRLLMKKRAYDG